MREWESERKFNRKEKKNCNYTVGFKWFLLLLLHYKHKNKSSWSSISQLFLSIILVVFHVMGCCFFLSISVCLHFIKTRKPGNREPYVKMCAIRVSHIFRVNQLNECIEVKSFEIALILFFFELMWYKFIQYICICSEYTHTQSRLRHRSHCSH